MSKKKNKSAKQQVSAPPAINKKIIRSWGLFGLIVVVYYGLSILPFYETYIQNPVSRVFTFMSSLVLNLLGQGTSSHMTTLSSADGFSLSVLQGCDAIAPIILLVTAILMFPTHWKVKLRGIGIGVALLFFVNLIRIISLFFIGKYYPSIFEFMHIEFWQVVFIGITIAYYIYWLNSSMKTSPDVAIS